MPIPANCDNAENSFRAKEEKDGGYPASVQGQYNYIFTTNAAVADVPDQRGKGIFIGSHMWIAVPGIPDTPAGMKYIHDEERVMHVKIRRYLIVSVKNIAVGKSF